MLKSLHDDKYVCISNTYKILVKDKLEWERFGQYLHFSKELEDFVEKFLDKNAVQGVMGQPGGEQIAERVSRIQERLNPDVNAETALPVFVATNQRDPDELKQLEDLGWKYVDHEDMGTIETLGIFGPMMVNQVLLAHAETLIGVQISTFSHMGA